MKKITKKRNPNDTTFRNINALKKRVKSLEIHIEALDWEVKNIYQLTKKKK